MIGKIVIGKSFYHALSYCLEDKQYLSREQKLELSRKDGCQHLDRAEILYYNKCSGNKKELVHDFSEVAHLSSRVEKPVLHLSLKLAPGEHLDTSKWIDVAGEAARDFKLENHQYIVVLHKDSKEEHIHILANRVGFEGKAISDSNSYKKVAELCRRLEGKLGLKEVLSPHLFLSPEQRQKHPWEHRIDQRKERMKIVIQNNLLTAKDFGDFKMKMERDGFTLQKGRGISFTDEKKVSFKGSQLGYSLRNIEKILEQKLEHRLELKQRLEQEKKVQSTPSVTSKGLTKVKEQQLIQRPGSQGNQLEQKQAGISLFNHHQAERILQELCGPEPSHALPDELTTEEDKRKKRKRQQQQERQSW